VVSVLRYCSCFHHGFNIQYFNGVNTGPRHHPGTLAGVAITQVWNVLVTLWKSSNWTLATEPRMRDAIALHASPTKSGTLNNMAASVESSLFLISKCLNSVQHTIYSVWPKYSSNATLWFSQQGYACFPLFVQHVMCNCLVIQLDRAISVHHQKQLVRVA